MKQEDKELLLKDLCARLPYNVILKCDSNVMMCIGPYTLDTITLDRIFNEHTEYVPFDVFKPYLFPLSSMTEEQYKALEESGILSNCSHSYKYLQHTHGVSFMFKKFKTYSLELIDWLNKNHFDYRGLIEKGLAIDATGLNIY